MIFAETPSRNSLIGGTILIVALVSAKAGSLAFPFADRTIGERRSMPDA